MKKIVMFAAVAALVFALSPAAHAGPVPVANHSFEETEGANIGGTMYYRIVDTQDVWADGTLDGHIQNAGQPCGPWNMRYWQTIESMGGDSIGSDARWPDWWSSNTAGPTDGLQAVIVDNRTFQFGGNTDPQANLSENDYMKQAIGTVGSIKAAGGPLASFQLDARYNGGSDDSDDFFEMYFEVGGNKVAAGAYKSLLDATRDVHTFAEIGTVLPLNPTKANPGVSRGVGPGNMETKTATADLTQFDDGEEVKIVIYNYREPNWNGTNWTSSGTGRVYIDNARVDATPEPATMGLLLFGGLGLLARRRRR